MTLGDKINDFLASYIRKTNVVVAEKKVEDNYRLSQVIMVKSQRNSLWKLMGNR